MYLIPEDMAPVAFLLTPIGESSGAKPMADESLSARLGKLTEQVVERATKGLAQGQGPSHIQATAASSAPSFFPWFLILSKPQLKKKSKSKTVFKICRDTNEISQQENFYVVSPSQKSCPRSHCCGPEVRLKHCDRKPCRGVVHKTVGMQRGEEVCHQLLRAQSA